MFPWPVCLCGCHVELLLEASRSWVLYPAWSMWNVDMIQLLLKVVSHAIDSLTGYTAVLYRLVLKYKRLTVWRHMSIREYSGFWEWIQAPCWLAMWVVYLAKRFLKWCRNTFATSFWGIFNASVTHIVFIRSFHIPKLLLEHGGQLMLSSIWSKNH